MLYKQKTTNFQPDMQVSEWILEYEWKILLVQRSQHCSSPGTWSGPGWKLEAKEILFRKYFYFLEKHIEIQFYKIHCEEKPEIILNDEHQNYIWIHPKDTLKINLTEDFDSIITEIYSL